MRLFIQCGENPSALIKLHSVSVVTSVIPLGINKSAPCYVTNRRRPRIWMLHEKKELLQ